MSFKGADGFAGGYAAAIRTKAENSLSPTALTALNLKVCTVPAVTPLVTVCEL